MELWKSGQDVLGSNVLDGHKWDKYCLDDWFVSHLGARIPCGGHWSSPGRWRGNGDDIISVAHRHRCIHLIAVQMWFYLFNLVSACDAEEKCGTLRELLCHCQKLRTLLPYWRCTKLEEKMLLWPYFLQHQHTEMWALKEHAFKCAIYKICSFTHYHVVTNQHDLSQYLPFAFYEMQCNESEWGLRMAVTFFLQKTWTWGWINYTELVLSQLSEYNNIKHHHKSEKNIYILNALQIVWSFCSWLKGYARCKDIILIKITSKVMEK